MIFQQSMSNTQQQFFYFQMKAFQKKYTLQQRKQKSQKQINQNPGKIPIIAEPHAKSKLPSLSNSKFLCEQHYKFNAVCSILSKKIDKVSGKVGKQGTTALFIFVNKNLINGEQTISDAYKKHKNEDGFLYITYGEMQAYG